MKKLLAAVLCAAIMITAGGCFGYISDNTTGGADASPSFVNGNITLPKGHASFLMCSENSTATSISFEYHFFDGTKSRLIQLKDDNLTINVSVTTTSGKLDLAVYDSDGNSIYSGKELATSEFKVTAKQAGKYAVVVNAEKHKGGFAVSWGGN